MDYIHSPMDTHPSIISSCLYFTVLIILHTLNHLATEQFKIIGPFVSDIVFYRIISQVTRILEFLLKNAWKITGKTRSSQNFGIEILTFRNLIP